MAASSFSILARRRSGIVSLALAASLAALTPGACLPTYTVVAGSGGTGGLPHADAGGEAAADAPEDACQSFDCDPKNCGGTNHDCLGGACVGGVCQPVVLADGLAVPAGLALSADTVFFSAGPTIWACPKAGCGAGGMSKVGVLTDSADVSALASDGTHLYWAVDDAVDGAVRRCPLPQCVMPDGGGVEPLAILLAYPMDLTLDSTSVYTSYGGSGFGTVIGCPLAGCGPLNKGKISFDTTISAPPTRLQVSPTDVYWTNGSAAPLSRCALTGCAGQPAVVASDTGPALALGPQGIYFGSETSLLFCPYVAACQPTVLVSVGTYPSAIVVDSAHVYWAEYGASQQTKGQIKRIPIAGGLAATLATEQDAPTRMAIDGTAIYWINSAYGLNSPMNGSLMRLAK